MRSKNLMHKVADLRLELYQFFFFLIQFLSQEAFKFHCE